MKIKNIFFVAFVFGLASCGAKISSSSPVQKDNNSVPIAFPGAEGYGKYTTGGRAGKILVVTNLNDDGEGSLRAALNQKISSTIIFLVAGTIHLETPLIIYSNVTIAGQSAPGDGICIADQTVTMKGNNIIVRYMRFRMGDRYQNKGFIDGAGGDDAFGGTRNHNVIIDHCSMSWSTDEVFSVYAGDSTTLQWNLIAEPLNYSYHFEKGDSDFEHHGYGAIWGGMHSTFHHNLFADCNSRTPRFNGIRHTKIEYCDYRNNVIYNWGGNNVYAGEGGVYNIVNNYYKPGPDTKETVKTRIANPYKRSDIPFGKWYISGNFMEGSNYITENNWRGVTMNEGNEADKMNAKLSSPFNAIEINTQTALDAYSVILKNVGASYKRDTLDERIINDVINRTGKIINVQGGFAHGTPYEKTILAWPVLKAAVAPVDSDGDGMPDEWEKANGLNPNDASDAIKISLHVFYTNIEVYLNSLIK